MILGIIFVVIALVVGYYYGKAVGKEAESNKNFHEDPDNKVNTENGDLQLLLFTKPQRYAYGRALVIGTKTEQAEAKKKLDDAIGNVKSIAVESMAEDLKRQGKL